MDEKMNEKTVHCLVVGEIATNCWIYPLEDSASQPGHPCVVIDPGDEAHLIIDNLKKLKLYPKYILLSHGHFDHLGALPALAAAFPAVIAIHKDESQYLGPMAGAAHKAVLRAALGGDFFQGDFGPLPEPGLFLSEGDELGPFKVLHLPGHSPGSLAFYDEKAKILFSGDTLFRDGFGRTDLPGGSTAELEKSLKRLFAMDADIRVFPGHGPETTIGREQ